MSKPNEAGILYIEIFLQGFFYGIYSGIVALYLHYQAPEKDNNSFDNNHFLRFQLCSYSGHCADSLLLYIAFIVNTSFACCDFSFIAQFILARNIRVVMTPSILAFAFLGIWLTSSYTTTVGWQRPMILTSITLSFAVNALVTGLIVFRIFKVFRGIKTTSDDHILGATGASKLRRIISILIESGMASFSIHLARIVVAIMETQAAYKALIIIASIHQMINVIKNIVHYYSLLYFTDDMGSGWGIIPTIIVVRTSI